MQENKVLQRQHSDWLFWLLLLLVAAAPELGRSWLQRLSWVGYLQGFSMMFISILLEALPFVLLGTLISAAIHLYLPQDALAYLLPRNRWLGLLTASLLGFFFPVCECAIVPITRSLVRKGVPIGMAVTFMLAVPIVNPVVLAATYTAFAGAWGVVLLRAVCGALVAIFAGDVIGRWYENTYPLRSKSFYEEHSHEAEQTEAAKPWISLLRHTSEELFAVGRYLVLGAALSAALQTTIPRHLLAAVGQNSWLSVLAMMSLAYFLSLCSEADAFVARTFVGQFSNGSILAFLVLGPMIDLKATLLWKGVFADHFVRRLSAIVVGSVLLVGLLANFCGL